MIKNTGFEDSCILPGAVLEEYIKIHFMMEESQYSLNETLKEFRKSEDSIPG
jgi:hypothetical protein